jgi:IstB-like ATP binding protein
VRFIVYSRRVRCAGNAAPVATWVYAGKRVWVRVSQGVRLEAMAASGAVITRHPPSRTKGTIIIDPAHYEGLRKETPHSHLVDEELAAKSDRSVNARIARARFPVLKTLEQFQFEFQPSIRQPRAKP